MENSVPTPGPGAGFAAPEPFNVVGPDAHLHQIVIVGGGAGGLELATKLGDRLGKKGKASVTLIEKARTHFWKPHLHEIAAGSMDLGTYELNHLAQSYWHGYRYRFGEVIGIDRKRKLVITAPYVDEHGEEVGS
jgi:NADH dehydrogenase